MKINLWNVYHLNRHKTRNVINYITKLEISQEQSLRMQRKFSEIKQEALSKHTADEMLDRIGFDVFKRDGIYDESQVERTG